MVRATGASYQFLAQIQCENDGETPVDFGFTPEQIATAIGVSVSDAPDGMTTDLQFLYTGDPPESKQFDLEGKDYPLVEGDSCIVELRLINPPGISGSFSLHVGDETKEISVED